MRVMAYIIVVIASFVAGAITFRACSPAVLPPAPVTRCDTVVVRDTVRVSVLSAEVVAIVRYDTVRPAPDTVLLRDTMPRIAPSGEMIVPIERKTYRSEDYTAVLEGYRPRLVSLEMYPKVTTITRMRSPRWALTAGPGVGYGPHGVQPYVGITLGVVLWSK